jgi:uncharacterized protein (TIGR02118 family)
MYKLVILIEPIQDQITFQEQWPQFLRLAEAMPGLRRETTSWVNGVIYGQHPVGMIHELFFDSRESLQQAMESPTGQEAGRTLQRLTQGSMTLLFAQHQEDELENIRAYREGKGRE